MRRGFAYCGRGNARIECQKIKERWRKCLCYTTIYLRTRGGGDTNNDKSKPLNTNNYLSGREGTGKEETGKGELSEHNSSACLALGMCILHNYKNKV